MQVKLFNKINESSTNITLLYTESEQNCIDLEEISDPLSKMSFSKRTMQIVTAHSGVYVLVQYKLLHNESRCEFHYTIHVCSCVLYAPRNVDM